MQWAFCSCIGLRLWAFSIILVQTAWMYAGMKLLGAVYFIWLGLASLQRAIGNQGCGTFFVAASNGSNGVNCLRSLREGFLSNILNPKAIIFYMAFLPQFIDPAKGVLLQSLLVAATHFSVGMVWLCLLASMIDRAKMWLSGRWVGPCVDGATGTVLL